MIFTSALSSVLSILLGVILIPIIGIAAGIIGIIGAILFCICSLLLSGFFIYLIIQSESEKTKPKSQEGFQNIEYSKDIHFENLQNFYNNKIKIFNSDLIISKSSNLDYSFF